MVEDTGLPKKSQEKAKKKYHELEVLLYYAITLNLDGGRPSFQEHILTHHTRKRHSYIGLLFSSRFID
jgi:hypothetical protein